LLQRNIRVDQGDTATNRLIEQTCSTLESSNFIHYNNGVTFLCESANFDVFQKTLVLNKAQVVNGGQTIRALYRASQKNTLRSDVLVPMRAIASTGNKDFANNVAVNQNNQNQIGTGFLRSNDQFVVQLDHALASLGWYLERREGELDSATAEEKAAISQRISHEVGGRVIKLKEAAQAYTSTFYGQPEIAKKNVRKIFLSVEDGGYYERIFSSAMTAEKIIIAHKIKIFVDEFVRKFATIRRRVQGSDLPDIISGYETVLGVDLAEKHYDVAHQVMPQCSLFVCGLIYKDLVENQSIEFTEIERVLDNRGSELIRFYLQSIMEFARNNKDKADRSWPVLLKSNAFFSLVVAYVGGQRKGAPT
jgi:AIPR protein